MSKMFILAGAFLFLTSCAGLTLGGTYEKEKVEKIKKIAVVGFSYDAPLETSNHMLSALSGKEENVGSGMMGVQKMETAEKETPAFRNTFTSLHLKEKKSS